MISRSALLVASLAAAAIPATASAAKPRIAKTCTPSKNLALLGGLTYGAGGFWTSGQPSRYATTGNQNPSFVRVNGSCSVASAAFPKKFRLTGTLFAGLGGQIWGSGDDDGSTFENVAFSGPKKGKVFAVPTSANYVGSFAVVGGRGLGSSSGALNWWTGPGTATPANFPSAPAGGSSLVAASDRIWMAVDGSFDSPNSIGYLANGAADVTPITAGISAGFSVHSVVVSGNTPWFTESDASGNQKLGTVVGTSVVEYPAGDTSGGGLVAAPGGGVLLFNKALNKILVFGADGKQSGTLKAPGGYRLIASASGGGAAAVLATQPNNGEGVGASKVLLIK